MRVLFWVRERLRRLESPYYLQQRLDVGKGATASAGRRQHEVDVCELRRRTAITSSCACEAMRDFAKMAGFF